MSINKYLLDENMSPLYREQLLRYKPDLILIAEAGEEDEYFDLISYLPLA